MVLTLMPTLLSKAALFLRIIYQKGVIDYRLMVLHQRKVWDLFKKKIGSKAKPIYLKSTFIYIVSAPTESNT